MKPAPFMNQTWGFEIPGPLIGHKCSVRAAFDKHFRAYKRTVRLLANVAGVPSALDENGIYRVDTRVWFTGRARTDVENVRKAILDALWARDRRVLAGTYLGLENCSSEKAFVTIERMA